MPTPLALPLPAPAVVVLIGASGAGKSTLAAALADQDPAVAVVGYDRCREEITGDESDQDATERAVRLAHRRVTERCAAGLTTVVDATHTLLAHRVVLVGMADRHHLPAVAIAVDTPLIVCLARQLDRPPRPPGARWGRRVDPRTVATQHRAVRRGLPTLHREGFASVHILTGGHR
ncbi:AAA family ATPase [Actinokineospora sp. NBRC 105648]|uniref:AAA family ATPase n=1 Tax=Actinokineospora sp. NBRC 105648 TaxID=3032206 RepID=UPI0024A26CF7|nr:AAA family ATPase [Actinokineospora sp. NBRC 105648]GLZ43513.1 hypothetical protein Acsp05_71370 [Actinokineospora sp. NBRC 105648]